MVSSETVDIGTLEKFLYKFSKFNFKKLCAKSFWEKTNEGLYVSRVKDGLIVCCNNVWARMCGFNKADEVIFKVKALDLYVDKNRRKELIDQLKSQGEVRDFEVNFKQMNGEKFWANLNSRLHNNGKLIEGVVSDITHRKNQEQKILEKQQQYEQMFEEFPGIVISVDTSNNKVLWVSKSIESILGYKPEEIIGDTTEKLYKNPKVRDYIYTESLKGGSEIREQEIELVTTNGNVLPFFFNIKVMENLNGGMPILYGFGRDITELKKREQLKIEIQTRQARQNILEGITGGIAHRFNNTLSSILGNVELASLEANGNKDLEKRLSVIHKSSLVLVDEVRTLLFLSATQIPRNLSVLDLNKDVIDSYLNSRKYKCLQKNYPNTNISTKLYQGLLNVKGDKRLLQDSLNDFILNAVEAHPQGAKLLISTENRLINKLNNFPINHGKYTLLSIIDEKEIVQFVDINRIFEPFYTQRVLARKKPSVGLTKANIIIEEHNGFVEVKNKYGTSFDLYLPAVKAED